MEQFIDIKYINNIVNMGFNSTNSFPNINTLENIEKDNSIILKKFKEIYQNTTNYLDRGTEKKLVSKIKQIENIKNKIFILIDNYDLITNINLENEYKYSNSSLINYDLKSESLVAKNFTEKKDTDFLKIFVIEDQIYVILATKIICLDNKSLEIVREWDIGERLYYFCLFECSQILKMNLDIFYVNFDNELKFFGKCLLFDVKQKTLYKEQNVIDKIYYHDGLLMWSSNFTIKIFDLKNKQMILRKSYDDVRDEVLKTFVEDYDIDKNRLNRVHSRFLKENNNANGDDLEKLKMNETLVYFINQKVLENKFKSINFFIKSNLICLNVGNKILHILKMDKLNMTVNNTFLGINIAFNLPNVNAPKPMKSYKVLDLFAFKTANYSKFLGFWMNTSLNKLSIIKEIFPRDKHYKFIEINIIKINVEEGSSEVILKRIFDNIVTKNQFRHSYTEKYSNFFIFDDSDFYNLTLIEKEEKILEDLKNNRIYGYNTFDQIYDNFNGFNFSQRSFIVFKILRNLEKFSIPKENLNENKQIIYMINSIIRLDTYHKKNSLHNNSSNIIQNFNYAVGVNQKNIKNDMCELQDFYFDNLIYIFNIFFKNKKLYYVYKILKKYIQKFFEISRQIQNNQVKKFSVLNLSIEKKMFELIDKIIVYSIINNVDESTNDSRNTEISSNEDRESTKNSSKNLERLNFDSHKNIKILLDLLDMEFIFKPNLFSKSLLYLVRKIYFSKIEKDKKEITFEEDFEGEITSLNQDNEKIIIQLFGNDEEKTINFFSDLLNYEILAKIFFKIEDYKKGVRCLIYGNKYMKIFNLMKLKRIPFEKVQEELATILLNFDSQQIIEIMDIFYENKNKKDELPSIDNIYIEPEFNNFSVKRFLKLLIDINKKKFDPKNILNDNINFPIEENLFNFYEIIEILMNSEKLKYFYDKKVLEEFLFYMIDKIIFHTNINSEEYEEKCKQYRNEISIIKKFLVSNEFLDSKKILQIYKNVLYSNPKLNELLLTLYELLHEYRSIIDSQIDILKDPELSISFIDNLTVTHNEKEELFDYLRIKILKSDYLTSIKKFYFINLFEDCEEGTTNTTIIQQVYEVKDEEDKKYIFLILEQFKLKLKILEISKSISITNFTSSSKELTRLSRKGKSYLNILKTKDILKCSYKFCKKKEIKKGDSINIFFNCEHIYHSSCLQNYSKKNEMKEIKPEDPSFDIDKIEKFEKIPLSNILYNSNKDNKCDLISCIICSEYEI